jgi:glycine/D-amino acid oxidase-like deaminating enzyme
MNPVSPWSIPIGGQQFPKLSGGVEVEVAVIGGGIAGVTVAYELAKAGKKVALLEQTRIGDGVTGWTTAFITYVTDVSLAKLEERFGPKHGRLAWEAGRMALDEIDRLVRDEKIACDFGRCPAYVYGVNEDNLKRLSAQSYVMQAAGFSALFANGELGFSAAGYLRIENQAKFDPIKYLKALSDRAVAAGVLVFEETEATSYGHGAMGITVNTASGMLTAKQLVLATHRPFQNPDQIGKRLVSNQTFALEAAVRSGLLAEGLYWDSDEPYHYFRLDKNGDHDRIILGGEDRPTGVSRSADRFSSLEDFLRRLLPDEKCEIKKEWSGEILETTDGLPFVGATAADPAVYVATGFSGNGMTFGTASALIIRDLILGRANDYARVFDPQRP